MSGFDDDGHAGRWRLALLLGGGAVFAATIVALVVLLGSATRQRDAALAWQQSSYEAMILARQLDASMGQSEAMLGRFVISGEPQFGQLYFDGWRRAGAQIDALDDQVDDPVTQRLITRLREVYDARGAELSDVALRTNYGQNPQALSKFYDAGKSPNVRRSSVLLEAIMARERTILAERTATADAKIGRSNSFGAILSALGVLLALGASVLGWVALQAAASRRDEERRAAELEDAVADRTAELIEANARLRDEMAEREAAEDALRQAQKMEAVGQLTGGIAHDFNNMLSVVIGGIELAQRRLAGGKADAPRHLENAIEGAHRAAALTKRLLAFSRAEALLPADTDPSALVADMSDLLDRVIGDTIAVKIEAEPATWPVFVDRHQLENALLNLAVNARDAMERGGTLTVAVGNVTLDDGAVHDAPPGDYVRIGVRDTGVGMSRAVLDRVFEPFFTTKDAGKGTGLGLSQIFGFVRQSGGAITVESEPGVGTTVSIYLPRHAARPRLPERPALAAPANDAPARPPRTVLVIEDDPRVLSATVEALKEIGHRAIPCAVATEAPMLLAERHDIDLIVSDVLMPGITGPELVAATRAAHPGLPVLFVTGFAGDVGEAAFGGHDVLRKPFTIGALSEAIDRVLDRAEPEARAA